MERAMGIEPTSLAWEARVIPLYDARVVCLLTALDSQGSEMHGVKAPAAAFYDHGR